MNGLTTRQRDGLGRAFRDATREAIKRVPIPRGATTADVVAAFDCAIDELTAGRRIVAALDGLPAKNGGAA